jgi:hypothetical protein
MGRAAVVASVLGQDALDVTGDAVENVGQVGVFVGDTISREALQKQESYHRTHCKGTDI